MRRRVLVSRIKQIVDLLELLDVYIPEINEIYANFKIKQEKYILELSKRDNPAGAGLDESAEIKRIMEILHSRNVLTDNRIEIEFLTG